MDSEQASQAISELLRSVTAALHRPGVLEVDFRTNIVNEEVLNEYHRASEEYAEWQNSILDAKAKLQASGFVVPDSWVRAAIVHAVKLRRRRDRGYWMVIRHDEREEMEKLKAELLLAGRRLQLEGGANSANSANTSRLFPGGLPRNLDVRDLVCKLDAEKQPGKSDNDIAREFTGETKGHDKKAKSLLSQIRRLKREGKVNL